MIQITIILAFGLALNSANAATPTHIRAAESVFDLLAPAPPINQIYGDNTKFPRPASDVFYNTYRTSFVKELAAKYSTTELTEIARSLAESETINAQLLEDLNEPVAISLQRAVHKLAGSQSLESSVDIISTGDHANNDTQE
jgi:hypothetical protein